MPRYSIGRHGGDDLYSWAVLDAHRPIQTGLSRDSAQRMARRLNGETRETIRTVRLGTQKLSQGRGRPRMVVSTYRVVRGRDWGERTLGYVVGQRGSWWEVPGYRAKLPTGPTFATVAEAAQHVAEQSIGVNAEAAAARG